MPIYAPPETLAALGGGLLPKCDSRSLFQDRFADPQAKDDKNHTPRKDWFESLIGTQRKAPATLPTFDWLPDHKETLHARLMSRLMLNMAGGVMENAGLLLDRYGLPVIPGSAVKGCARRMAVQALHDWIDHQQEKGSEERPAEDDACAPCCEGFTIPAQMLATIARVFGWVEQDWDGGKNRDPKTKEETTWKSDFGWATSGNIELMNAAHAQAGPSKSFGGTIAFLSAKPNQDPNLELDVVTPHHTKYYQGERGYENAPDTEDPVPVFFPAIKSQEGTQNHFTFPLLPLRLAKAGEVKAARTWLAYGLEIFGIGAKTNAGYGEFSVLDVEGNPIDSSRISALDATRQLAELALLEMPVYIEEAAAPAKPCSTLPTNPELIARFDGLRPDQLRGFVNLFKGNESQWPKEPKLEASAEFQISLIAYLTEINPEDYETEKGYAHSKFVAVLRRLAASHNVSLPE